MGRGGQRHTGGRATPLGWVRQGDSAGWVVGGLVSCAGRGGRRRAAGQERGARSDGRPLVRAHPGSTTSWWLQDTLPKRRRDGGGAEPHVLGKGPLEAKGPGDGAEAWWMGVWTHQDGLGPGCTCRLNGHGAASSRRHVQGPHCFLPTHLLTPAGGTPAAATARRLDRGDPAPVGPRRPRAGRPPYPHLSGAHGAARCAIGELGGGGLGARSREIGSHSRGTAERHSQRAYAQSPPCVPVGVMASTNRRTDACGWDDLRTPDFVDADEQGGLAGSLEHRL